MTDDTMLYRQVHPIWVQNGRVSSQVFRPTPKDQHQLSVNDGDLISAENSWKHFSGRGLKSAGVLAVTVRECNAESLRCQPSPEVFPEHAHIDFSGFTEGQIKGKGKRLTELANTRGWQYQV